TRLQGDCSSDVCYSDLRGPWGIGTDGGDKLDADFGRISAAPRFGTREIWNLVNDGGGWDHPVHIHFEEGQILNRGEGNVPATEKIGRAAGREVAGSMVG